MKPLTESVEIIVKGTDVEDETKGTELKIKINIKD
jgi:hypothetical protein